MTITINPERLATLPTLRPGKHRAGTDMCVMEAAAYLAGEAWSDHPECVCPVIAAFLRSWNDSLPSDADRDRLLKPLIPIVIGSRSTSKIELRRAWMAVDWMVRGYAPAWLDAAGLTAEASALRACGELRDAKSALSSKAAQEAARKLADAAGATARYAAGATARYAAGATAGAAAGAAAWAALAPTVATLQESAVDLVRRMCEAKDAAR